MESEKAMVIGIVLGICLFLFLTCGLWLPNVKWLFPEKQEEKDNIVLYINQDENTNSRNIDIIDMPDCEMGWVDYNSEKKTVLYINNQNNITEKNLESGAIRTLVEVNTNGNYILKCIEDRYLVYVEKRSVFIKRKTV